ncbi:MAG: histidine phosphatase family protein [Paracoccus sp. (in: a-proteobacteria)]|nr:histidine phosphatase family protein [Paracoccus sp. (in: a-proteobacteria)]
MNMRPDLYLMRHGETFWNVEGRLQGACDSALTPKGIEQAARQALIVADISGRCVSSPQGRARQTAERVFGAREWSVDARLAEIGIGGFAGRLLPDVQAAHPHLFHGPPLDWYDHCPQGEGLDALADRCRRFLDDLDGPALVVTHGITLRMLRVLALGLTVRQLADKDMAQGVVYKVHRGLCETLR